MKGAKVIISCLMIAAIAISLYHLFLRTYTKSVYLLLIKEGRGRIYVNSEQAQGVHEVKLVKKGYLNSYWPVRVTVKAVPDEGWKVAFIQVEGVPFRAEEVSFQVKGNMTVKVVFRRIVCDLKTKVEGNGRVEPANYSGYYGDVVRLSVIPERGYAVREILLDGRPLAFENNTLALRLTANSTLLVRFKPVYRTLSLRLHGRGLAQLLMPNGTLILETQEKANYTGLKDHPIIVRLLAHEGWELAKLLLDGEEVSTFNYTLTIPMSYNHTLEAYFGRMNCTLLAYILEGEGIVYPANITVPYGTLLNITIMPKEGYLTWEVRLDG
ncbi:MAG: hypothetical protein J7L11_05585, partial [Thermoprotei archaeon]|nr:hypothetical protein [Thermoprotei archaeon]